MKWGPRLLIERRRKREEDEKRANALEWGSEKILDSSNIIKGGKISQSILIFFLLAGLCFSLFWRGKKCRISLCVGISGAQAAAAVEEAAAVAVVVGLMYEDLCVSLFR